MTNNFDVIDAFIDGERVDPTALESALADPNGRRHFTDLIALREVIRTPDAVAAAAPSRHRSWRWIAAAAVMLAAVGSAYVAGTHIERTRVRVETGSAVKAPAPTRVIELKPGVDWRESGGGR